MVVAGLFLTGLAVICVEIWAITRLGTLSSKERRISLIAGVLLSICSPFMGYYYSNSQWVLGIPFPAAAYEFSNGAWLDFVGPTTPFFLLLNAGVSFGLPLAAIVIRHKFQERRDLFERTADS